MLNTNTAERSTSILVVEDERIISLDLERTLGDLGYRVPYTAASAEEAIACASAECPDLVLMDIRIRGDRDGIETAAVLRDRFDVPVVYLTAHADEDTLARARATNPYGYLLKPFNEREMRAAIELALYKHRMETLLRQRERWLSVTLRSIGDAVIAVDALGNVTFMNQVAESLTGWPSSEATGRSIHDVLQLVNERTGESTDNPVRRALAEGTVMRLPPGNVVRAKGGETRPVEDSAAPIVDDGGETLGAVVVLADVTERRELERQAALADRLGSLGTLAAGVAHEINNPLAYVLSNLALLSDKVEALAGGEPTAPGRAELDEVQPLLADAIEGAERIRDIVSDLRLFSSSPNGAEAGVDLGEAVKWALRLTRKHLDAKARVVTELEPVPRVEGDEHRVGQVLTNLLVNAAQAIPGGVTSDHTVTVTTRTSARGEAVVSIADTGSGIPRDVLERIFDPFFTTKPLGQGSGLGLAVSHGIVTSLGGRIEVDTEPGRGSRFTVVLPPKALHAEDEPASRDARSSQATHATSPPHRGRVLVVDDEVLLARVLVRMIKRHHDVTMASESTEALERILAGERFDAILCDLMMPTLTGPELYLKVLALDPEQASRFVFMTGGAFTTQAQEFLEQVGDRRLEKPIDRDRLLATIDELVREPPTDL